MSLVYGFGGLRSDGETLSFEPELPAHWDALSFRLLYRDSLLQVRVDPEWVTLKTVSGPAVVVRVFGEAYEIGAEDQRVPLPAERRGQTPA
jgi:maltose phosphorylase